MKTITYIFWRLYRYFKKIRQEPYYRSLFIFSFPYSFLIMGHTILFLNSYNVEEWIKIMITCMEVFILPLPLKYLFPKKKIENLEYTKEEKRQMNRKLLVCLVVVILIIFFSYFHKISLFYIIDF